MIGVILGVIVFGICSQVIKFNNYHKELKRQVVKIEALNDTLRQANAGLYQEVMAIKSDMEVIAGKVNMAKDVKELNKALGLYTYMYRIYFVPPTQPQTVKLDTSETVKPDSVKPDSTKPATKKRWSLFGHK